MAVRTINRKLEAEGGDRGPGPAPARNTIFIATERKPDGYQVHGRRPVETHSVLWPTNS